MKRFAFKRYAPRLVAVFCPNCDNHFVVEVGPFKEGVGWQGDTRPCPYCCKMSYVREPKPSTGPIGRNLRRRRGR